MGLTTGITALLGAAALHTPATVATPYQANRDATFSQSCAVPYKLCHMIFSRSYTKNVLAPASSGGATSITAGMTAACTAVGGPPGGLACAALFGILGGGANAAIAQAAAQNQCADYVADVTDTVGWFQTNNGPECH